VLADVTQQQQGVALDGIEKAEGIWDSVF